MSSRCGCSYEQIYPNASVEISTEAVSEDSDELIEGAITLATMTDETKDTSFESVAFTMTIIVVVLSLLLGAVAILIPSKARGNLVEVD